MSDKKYILVGAKSFANLHGAFVQGKEYTAEQVGLSIDKLNYAGEPFFQEAGWVPEGEAAIVQSDPVSVTQILSEPDAPRATVKTGAKKTVVVGRRAPTTDLDADLAV